MIVVPFTIDLKGAFCSTIKAPETKSQLTTLAAKWSPKRKQIFFRTIALGTYTSNHFTIRKEFRPEKKFCKNSKD